MSSWKNNTPLKVYETHSMSINTKSLLSDVWTNPWFLLFRLPEYIHFSLQATTPPHPPLTSRSCAYSWLFTRPSAQLLGIHRGFHDSDWSQAQGYRYCQSIFFFCEEATSADNAWVPLPDVALPFNSFKTGVSDMSFFLRTMSPSLKRMSKLCQTADCSL